MFSLIIPIYKNEVNLDRLLEEAVKLSARSPETLEVVFVVDGSPDRCHDILRARFPQLPLRSQLLLLSRNFGSFAAVTAGLEAARGDFFAVLAADLQEPPELVESFFKILSEDRADIVFGTRRESIRPGSQRARIWRVLEDLPPFCDQRHAKRRRRYIRL